MLCTSTDRPRTKGDDITTGWTAACPISHTNCARKIAIKHIFFVVWDIRCCRCGTYGVAGNEEYLHKHQKTILVKNATSFETPRAIRNSLRISNNK